MRDILIVVDMQNDFVTDASNLEIDDTGIDDIGIGDRMEKLIKQLENYIPFNEQEKRDKKIMLEWLREGKTPFTREKEVAHFTDSSWIVNKQRTKVLMVYHNIYNSWSWTGGHADGDNDLLAVAVREGMEETGVEHLRPVSEDIFSIETIVVDGHEKRGSYVASHLHMNVSYLLEADEEESLHMKPDENSGVKWIPIEKLHEMVSEPWMLQRIYDKLNAKMSQY